MYTSQKKILLETPSSIVQTRKFDTAIRLTTVLQFMKRYDSNTLTDDDKMITKSNLFEDIEDKSPSTLAYTDILSKIFDDSSEQILYNPKFSIQNKKRQLEIMEKTLSVQVNYMMEKYELDNKLNTQIKVHEFLKRQNLPTLILNLISINNEIHDIIDMLPKINSRDIYNLKGTDKLEAILKCNSSHIKDLNLTFVWSSKLVYVKTHVRNYVLPKPYILMIHNKICDLISVLVYSCACEGILYPINSYTITVKFMTELMMLHYMYDNKFYKIAKSLEPLCIAETLQELENYKNDDFLRVMSKSLKTDSKFPYMQSKIRKILKSVSSPFRHELCCMSKLLGHPLVDMEAGSISLQKKTNESYNLNLSKIVECECYIKENYIRNHIMRHGKWPPTSLKSKNMSNALKYAWSTNSDPKSPKVTSKYGEVKILDYMHVSIEENMKFNNLNNAIPYLKDKTISLLRSDVISTYITHPDKNVSTSWKDTRLLLYYLLREKSETDHVDWMKTYENTKDFEEVLDYLVMRLVPKELELKEEFRGFGCQTYKARMKCLMQEKNVMHYLDLYSDEQAMTLDELEMMKKLHAFRNITKAYMNHSVIYINLDASSWNNHFRKETVDSIMKETLCKVFKNKCFGITQQCYENTLFYVPDEGETYFWNGQAGGIDGLNQDTWVVVYIGQIKTALQDFELKYHILCKGDDFRLVVLVPPKVEEVRPLNILKNDIVTKISDIAKGFGHNIKIDDSYGSSVYFSFSKAASYKTIEYPQSYRKIQKTHGANNAFLPTIDDYIASTFSNAHSSCAVSPTSVQSYWVGIFWASYYLLKDENYRKLNNDQLITLLLTPSVVGGFAVIYLHNMSVRAESDLLAPYLGLLEYCGRKESKIFRYLKQFAKLPRKKVNTIKSLLKDPYSIPIDRPDLPSSILRRCIVPALRSMVENEEVIKLFTAYDTRFSEQIIHSLSTCVPFNPKVMALIYSATPEGLVEELCHKFESSRSIQELLILKRGKAYANRILRKVIRADMNLQRWRIDRINGIPNSRVKSYLGHLTQCPGESAAIVRKLAWGQYCEGITMPPLQHQVRLSTDLNSSNPSWDISNFFSLNKHPTTFSIPNTCGNVNWSSGGQEPFIGIRTTASIDQPTVHLIEKDPILSKIKTLLELHSWVDCSMMTNDGMLDSNLPSVIESVLSLYTSVPINHLRPFAGHKKGGTIQHHIRAPNFRESIVRNSLSNNYLLYSGNSYTHSRLSHSKSHHLVNYFHIYCYSVFVCSLENNFGSTNSLDGHIRAITDQCLWCIKPIQETPIICDVSKLPTRNDKKILSTKIGARAIKILTDALSEFQDSNYADLIPIEQLSVRAASAGMFQELVDTCSRTRRKLEVMYTQHTVTSAGFKTLSALQTKTMKGNFDLSDIRIVPPLYLAESLCQIIYASMLKMFPKVDKDNIGYWMTMIPVQELPWYHIVESIFDVNLLNEVVQQFTKWSNVSPGTSYVNVSEACYYFGIIGYMRVCEWESFPHSIYLTYYSPEYYSKHFNSCLKVNLRVLFRKCFLPIFKEANAKWSKQKYDNNNVFDLHALKMISCLYLIYSCDTQDIEYIDGIINDIKVDNTSCVPLVPLDSIDEDIIELENNKDALTDHGWYSIEKEYQHIDWTLIRDYVLEHFEECRIRASEIIENHPIIIIVSTPIDCLRTIKTSPHIQDEDITENDDSLEVNRPNDIINSIPKIQIKNVQSHETTMIFKNLNPNKVNHFTRLPEYSFQDDKVILNINEMYRPYGQVTSSISKMCEIWYILGMPSSLTENLVSTVLGDGLGGTSSFLCSVSPNSHIIFVTIPDRPLQEPFPHSTKELAEQNNVTILHKHIKKGYSDMSNNLTPMELEKYNLLNNIVINDIEPQHKPEDYHLKIQFNCAAYYLRNRTSDSLYISQVNFEKPNVIYQTICFLAIYCYNVILVTPRSANRNGQSYIVAWGIRNAYLGDYNSIETFEDMTVYSGLLKYIDKQFSIYCNKLNHSEHKFDINIINWSMFNPWMYTLPNRLYTVMWKQLKIIMDFDRTHNMCQLSTSTYDIVNNLYPDKIKSYLNDYEKMMNQSHDSLGNKLGINLNTRTHINKIASMYLRYHGFQDIINHYIKQKSGIIDDTLIRMMYDRVISKLPARLKYSPVNGKHFKYKMDIDGFKCSPYVNYFKGCKLGILFIQTIIWYKS